ncbi:RagB/SusD family nutrient uptake outer membrane protein [Flavobacterium sp. DGU38]|uniref:RagB/SusD family nutrient uptake outer membrane protein n=2 Tax=Flavobacterium calami TaxID=3139144 RepID=A0ABU9IPM1_9FLAO
MCTVWQSCESFTEIDPPRNKIVKQDAFADETSANAAVLGIYLQLSSVGFGQGQTTVILGQSSDEIYKNFDDSSSTQLHTNDLVANNGNIKDLWTSIYAVIGQSNAVLEGLENNTNIPEVKRQQFVSEAKFVRAYCYLYLTQLWGDVPLITTTDWSLNSKAKRTAQAEITALIIQDLKQAAEFLPETVTNNIRAKKTVALGLLSRVYLYEKNWSEAQRYAEMTIAGTVGASAILPDASEVFYPESAETIFQIVPQKFYSSSFESTLMHLFGPDHLLEANLVSDFEDGDLRKTAWVGETDGNYFAAKYTTNPYETSGRPQYNVLLRAAEQFLIAAEAQAQQSNITGAVENINVIRRRAGLIEIDAQGLSQSECLSLIEKERRTELFAEWGHRWLDLKRTGRAAEVLGGITGKNWKAEDALYPIPTTEIRLNPNLTQNKDY